MPLPWAGAQDDPQNVGESAQAPPTDNDAMLTINIVAIEGDQPRRNDTQFTIVARQ